MSVANTIQFLTEIDKLKEVERKTLNYFGDRLERSAEHSWHLASAVVTCLPYAQDQGRINLEKALKMALLHDIVEIDAGDVMIYEANDETFLEEKQAAERIFGLLPGPIGAEFLELWLEFEARQTPEAVYVKALDRFLPLYSNCLHAGYSWSRFGITLDQVVARNRSIIQDGAPALWDFVFPKISLIFTEEALISAPKA